MTASDAIVSRSARIGWRMSPGAEAAGLAGLAAVTMMLTLVALGVTAIGAVARIPLVATMFGWCERLAGTVPWWIGVPATISLAGLVAGGFRVAWRHLRARPAKDAPGVVVVNTPRVFAYSVGGRGGQVVASRGLLDRIEPSERKVIFAHEAAHLRLHHHRLLLLGDIAALNPLMRPLRKRLRFALERAADEEAVRAVRDRALVARTVGRVALLSFDASPVQALSMDGAGVVERVEALLAPDEVTFPHGAVAAGAGVTLLAGLLGLSQWAHLAQLAHHLCSI